MGGLGSVDVANFAHALLMLFLLNDLPVGVLFMVGGCNHADRTNESPRKSRTTLNPRSAAKSISRLAHKWDRRIYFGYSIFSIERRKCMGRLRIFCMGFK